MLPILLFCIYCIYSIVFYVAFNIIGKVQLTMVLYHIN